MRSLLQRIALAISLLAISLLFDIVHAIEFTDIAGRTVTIDDDKKIERILLGEGRYIHALALLEGDKPFDRLIGWQGDFKKLDPQTYEAYRAKFPEIDRIALIGNSTPESISPEKALALMPDIAIFGLAGHGPSRDSGLVKHLESAGVPVVFVDFRTSPLENTIPSIRVLGKALQREVEAEAYIEFYERELKRVTDVTSKIEEKDKRTLYFDLRAGSFDSCCTTAGDGNMGNFVDVAGGINIAKNLLPAALGEINLEKLIIADPQIFISTGAGKPNDGAAGIPFGMQTSEEQARKGLKSVLNRKGIKDLTAVKEGNVYGLWHHYYNSPQNIVAIQNIAKWLYPEKFEDLDPRATLQTIHDDFLPIELQGTFWIELKRE